MLENLVKLEQVNQSKYLKVLVLYEELDENILKDKLNLKIIRLIKILYINLVKIYSLSQNIIIVFSKSIELIKLDKILRIKNYLKCLNMIKLLEIIYNSFYF